MCVDRVEREEKKGSLIKQSAIDQTMGLCPEKKEEEPNERNFSTSIIGETQRKLHTSPDGEIPRTKIHICFYISGWEGNARKENNRKSDTRCKHYWNDGAH